MPPFARSMNKYVVLRLKCQRRWFTQRGEGVYQRHTSVEGTHEEHYLISAPRSQEGNLTPVSDILQHR